MLNKIGVLLIVALMSSRLLAADRSSPNHLLGSTKELIQLATQGDPAAQLCLGKMYAMGMDVERDPSQAMYWYKKAAKQGYLGAKWAIASSQTWVPKKYPEAIKTIQDMASRGYAPAEEQVGQLYLFGDIADGFPRNFEKAWEWYRKSAAQGYAEAEADIGLAYRHGWGVTPDRKLASEWARKAASHFINCGPDVVPLIEKLIAINADYPKDVVNGKLGARVSVKLLYRNGQFIDPSLVRSTGNKVLDSAAIMAMKNIHLPTWAGMGSYVIVAVDLTKKSGNPLSSIEQK